MSEIFKFHEYFCYFYSYYFEDDFFVVTSIVTLREQFKMKTIQEWEIQVEN